jgi:hypothetical protein
MRRFRRHWRPTIELAAVLLLVFAATAFAGSAVIANGTVDTDGVLGPRHTLTSVDVDWNGGSGSGCVRAKEDDGSWASTKLCTFTYTSQALCGCALRYGWNGAGSATASVVGVELY